MNFGLSKPSCCTIHQPPLHSTSQRSCIEQGIYCQLDMPIIHICFFLYSPIQELFYMLWCNLFCVYLLCSRKFCMRNFLRPVNYTQVHAKAYLNFICVCNVSQFHVKSKEHGVNMNHKVSYPKPLPGNKSEIMHTQTCTYSVLNRELASKYAIVLDAHQT